MLDRLFKTTLILSSTQVFSRLLSFGFSLILARYLGVELFGKFTYVYSLVFLLIVVVDFGLSMLTVREMVQNKSDVNSYLLHSLLIRLFLAGILYSILLYHSAIVSNIDFEKGRLIMLLGLYLFVRAVFDTTNTYFQAYERQDINGYLNLANNFVLIFAGIGFVIFQKNVFYFAIAPILAGIIASIISLYIMLSKISLKFNFSFKFLKTLFINTIPFGFTLFATAAYARMNILILSWLRSDLEVGEYGASLRLVEGFLIIPIVGARIIYPVLSRFSKDREYFQIIVEKSIKILIISAFFIITVGFISSEVIIVSLYSSSYANSVVIFQILVITLISAYPNYVLGSSLFSLNRQKMVLRVVFSALIFNIILSLSLIPIHGGS
ncbi:MAG: flippase, partial [Ignavibacteria bacterium]|nr:flippase [Ignavibacteria bacterium]